MPINAATALFVAIFVPATFGPLVADLVASVVCAYSAPAPSVRQSLFLLATQVWNHLHNSWQQIVQESDQLYSGRAEIANVAQSIALLTKAADDYEPDCEPRYEVAWRLGRALFFVGQESRDKQAARDLHVSGVAASLKATRAGSDRVEGHFWLGVNLALLAQSEPLHKSVVHALQARRALQRAISIDPAYHAAGPYRVLARLQHKLPRLLGGGVTRAKANFARAINIAPANTVTRIYFAELLLEVGDATRARFELQQILSAPIDQDWAFEIERDRQEASAMIRRLANSDRQADAATKP